MLRAGESLTSDNGNHSPVFGLDGNLVLKKDGSEVWTSNTGGANARNLVPQSDGCLKLYGSSHTVLWGSQTYGTGSVAILHNNGNCCLYDKKGKTVWQTNTAQGNGS